MTRLKILVAAALLAVPVGLIGTTLVGPAHAHAHAEPVLQACQPSNLTGLPTAVRDCKLGYVRMYGRGTYRQSGPGPPRTACGPVLKRQWLALPSVCSAGPDGLRPPRGIWISAPDYLTGCEAAKRSLIEHGYQ